MAGRDGSARASGRKADRARADAAAAALAELDEAAIADAAAFGSASSGNRLYAAKKAARADEMEANSRLMGFCLELATLPSPAYGDGEEMARRFSEYADLCAKWGTRPTVSSMAMAFGMRMQEFRGIGCDDPKFDAWRGGVLTESSREVIRKAYDFMLASWESNLLEEKGNPVKWIFIGKNHFGMRDQTEQVQVRIDARRALPSAEEVAARYSAMLGQPVTPPEASEGVYEVPFESE